MAARKQYGSSWWGEQWLNALSQIDFSNRLPRGKTYANTGKVKDIQIKDGAISAKVKGSKPTPYKQTLSLHPFTDAQAQRILALIAEQPHLLSVLLNRELPSQLLALLEQEGIWMLPRKWQDFGTAKCSCPDYALPCKHLAAVIYMVANEIDQNPFLIFSLRGLDLLEALQRLGLTTASEAASIPIVELDASFPKPIAKALLQEQQAFEASEQAAAAIDFSALPPALHKLASLLDERPHFAQPDDFKALYTAQAAKLAKALQKRLSAEADLPADSFHRLANTEGFQVVLDAEGRFASAGEYGDFMSLADALHGMPLAHLGDCPAPLRAVYFYQAAARHLWAKGCVVPQLVRLSETRFRIRWMPALLEEEVKRLAGRLAQLLPPAVLAMPKGRKHYTAEGEEQGIALLSVFLDGFSAAFSSLPADAPPALWQFFALQPIDASSFTTRETPQSIQKWLQKFSFAARRFMPLLSVEEEEKGREGFLLSAWVEDRENALEPPMPVAKFLSSTLKKHREARTALLRDMGLLTQYVPALAQSLQREASTAWPISLDDFAPIFLTALPMLRLMGIKVQLPKTLERAVRPRLQGRVSSQGSTVGSRFMTMSSLLDFEWQVAIGDARLSAAELRKLLRDSRKLVKLQDQYVLLDEKQLLSLLQQLESPAPDAHALLRGLLAEEVDGAPLLLSDELQAAIEAVRSAPGVPLPAGLQAELRPYQRRGYEWLCKNAALGIGSLLADDMGLGKTLQTIAFMLKLKEDGRLGEGKILVVAPTTLLGNWQREIARFAPGLSASIFHGNARLFDEAADVVLTSYGLARTEQKLLAKKPWVLLAIDEAQNIKNPNTAQTKAVKKIPATHLLALSGTPVENRLSEYWSILDFANRDFLGPLKTFANEFAKPIEIERNRQTLEAFRKVTSPFILRRLKTDKSIIQDLPDKVEQQRLCTLTPEQAALYETVMEKLLQKLEGTQDNISRQGLVLQMITQLKQLCNHPAQFLKKGKPDPELSGKSIALLDILDSIVEAGEKVLIFTQYKEMGDLLQAMIEERIGQAPLWLHGGCTVKQRNEMVDAFQKKAYPKVMLLSLKAGGTGLNLTEANHVVHYDLWWNPAVEAQATDRAFRIGQRKNVMVYRFVTKGTFEEKIDAMIRSKRELADMAVEAGETWIGNYSNDELRELFRLQA